MGEAVFLAATSTILAVSLLFTSTSAILVGLTTLLSGIMVIGLYNFTSFYSSGDWSREGKNYDV